MGTWRSKLDTTKSDFQNQRYRFIQSLIKGERQACQEKGDDDRVDTGCSQIDPKEYEFPFENLVFEGGGSKGLAYCGAVQYLEEIGVMPNIKRYSGTSAGAMMATLLAVGYNSSEIRTLMGQDLKEVLLDGTYLKAMRNLFWSFGVHPGHRIYEWLGERLKHRTGSADITFEEVRKKYGRELCVVVTNLNWMRTEYCHPKTTPDMPVRLALRMSMSIPGLFTAIKYPMYGDNDIFVDGGILCNYPIHCFDGWFLSMAKGDNFIKRFQLSTDLPTIHESRFKEGKLNTKTLGLQLYAEGDRDFLRNAIECRCGTSIQPEKPDKETKLYRKWMEKQEDQKKMELVQHRLTDAMNTFFKVLDKRAQDSDVIDRKCFEETIKDKDFTSTQAEVLFAKDVDVKDVFECLDRNKDGTIHYSELITSVGELGIHLHNRSFEYRRRDIYSLYSFAHGIESTLLVNSKKISVKPSDVQRTIGINTGHVTTTDFVMEEADKRFLMKRGYNACKVFLQQFVAENKLQPKSSEDDKSECD